MNQACPKKWTAIHEAAKVGCTDILALLLQHGGNVSETDENGVTPMGIAAEYAQAEALDILIHYGNTGISKKKQRMLLDIHKGRMKLQHYRYNKPVN